MLARRGGGGTFGAASFVDHENALYFYAGTTTASGALFRYCGGGLVERVTDLFAGSSHVEGRPTADRDGLEDDRDDDWSTNVP